jgi:cell division protein FtsL
MIDLYALAIALNIVSIIYVYLTLKSRILYLKVKIEKLEDKINGERIVFLGGGER